MKSEYVLYKYLTSLPYGTVVSVGEAIEAVFPGVQFSDKELYSLTEAIVGMFAKSEDFFQDWSGSVGRFVGLPFCVPFVVRLYRGLLEEFQNGKVRRIGSRYLVCAKPGQLVSFENIHDCFPQVAWWTLVRGEGLFENEVVDVGRGFGLVDGAAFDSYVRNVGSSEMYVYFVVVEEREHPFVLDERHELLSYSGGCGMCVHNVSGTTCEFFPKAIPSVLLTGQERCVDFVEKCRSL